MVTIHMSRHILYLLAFCTNALVLVFEITGGRLLAPYVGTSVGVWAGLIAVVLGGMALGYHWGGRMADIDASPRRIGLIVLAAGIAALIAWSLRDLVPTIVTATRLEPTMDALLVGAILFMPAVVLLASVSPFLAKNLLSTLNTSGHVVGELNAVGTAGAIVGAIGTGMYLIPTYSVDLILLGVAMALFLLSIIILKGNLARLGVSIVLAAALALYFNTLPTRADGWLMERSTAYNRIVVTMEDGPTRAVWTSPFGIQCQMYVKEDGSVDLSRLVESYQRAHDLVVTEFFPEGPNRGLFLGGCIAAFPRYLLTRFPTMDTTVVEIDPGMTEVAEELFDFDPSTVHMVHADARVFVNEAHEPYDLVYMDAFGSSGRVPFHLVTEEMFARLATHVSEDGILIMNTHGSYEGSGLLYPAVFLKTARTAFAHVELYQFTNNPAVAQNLVIVASHSRELPDTFVGKELTLRRVEAPENVQTVTDSYAPVEGIAREGLVD